MIQKLYFFESPGLDPYRNLAIEESLLAQAGDCAILYLWQNENTVVIGKNQNPWKECRTALLAQEGGKLARRSSGGGAVYHGTGNLNFTIVLPREDYDLDRQLSVIRQAVASLGIPAVFSGRNDLLVEGRKFSGSAFYKTGTAACHHGTLLIREDMEKLSRYLSPSRQKLQAKGVDSVRSRVGNLCLWKPDITVAEVKAALKAAFSQVYGLPLEPLPGLEETRIAPLTARNASWEWNYGQKLPFSWILEGRFSWGSLELHLEADHGKIRQAKLYTDAMEPHWVPLAEQALAGCPLEAGALEAALSHLDQGADIAALFRDT